MPADGNAIAFCIHAVPVPDPDAMATGRDRGTKEEFLENPVVSVPVEPPCPTVPHSVPIF